MVALRIGLAIFVLPLVVGVSQTPQNSTETKREALYQWFDRLGYDAVRTGRFVKCDLIQRYKGGDGYPSTDYGFLVASSDKGFTILTPDLRTRSFPEKSDMGTTTGKFSDGDFKAWALERQKQYKSFPVTQNRRWADIGSLALARECALKGLTSIEDFFFKYACSGASSAEGLEDDFLTSNRSLTKSNVNSELANAAIPRGRILADFEAWVKTNKDKPDDYMTESCQVLKSMVDEERNHPKYTQVQIDALPVDQRVKELVFELRDAAEHQVTNPGDVDFLGRMFTLDGKPDDASMGPAFQLYRLRLAAVPQLIDALADRSFTRSQRMMRITEGDIPRVQDAAFQILEAIASRSFYDNNDTDHRVYIGGNPNGETYEQGVKRMQNEEHTAQGKRIRKWWADVQAEGEPRVLADMVESGQYSMTESAERLIELDPVLAEKSIRIGLKHTQPQADSSRLLKMLEKLKGGKDTALFRDQMTTATTIEGKVTAAWIVSKKDPDAAVATMEKELERQYGHPGESSSFNNYDFDDLLRFLIRSHRPSVIPLLKEGMALSDTVKDEIILDLGPNPSLDENAQSIQMMASLTAADKSNFDKSVEEILVGELQDTVRRTRGPDRFCDNACEALSHNWRETYTFDPQANREFKTNQCLSALNTWRTVHRLPLLKELRPEPFDSLTDQKMKPLIDVIENAGAASAKKAAVDEVLQLGLPALKAVSRASGHNADLSNLEGQLSSIVRNVVIKGTPPPCALNLTKDLLGLKGKPLTYETLRGLIVKDFRNWTRRAPGGRISGERLPGDGFVLTLEFPTIEQASGSGGWCCDSTGRHGDVEIAMGGGVYRDFTFPAFAEAFKAKPSEEIQFTVVIWNNA